MKEIFIHHAAIWEQVAGRCGGKSQEAQNARDALAKAIYVKLFDNIVSCINKAIPFSSSANFIGLLDIAGFG